MEMPKPERRRDRRCIPILFLIPHILCALIMTAVACFLVYLLQSAFCESVERGCQSSTVLPETVVAKTGSLKRPKRKVSGKGDECLSAYNGIELNYVKGSTSSFTFDLCDVNNCKEASSSWRGYNVWVVGTIR